MTYGVDIPQVMNDPSLSEYLKRWLYSIFTVDQSRVGVVTKTAAYTLAENIEMVLADTTSAGFTVTLPSAVGRRGREITIKKISSDGNTLTIGTGGGNIDGASTKTTTIQYVSFTMKSDGTVWWIK